MMRRGGTVWCELCDGGGRYGVSCVLARGRGDAMSPAGRSMALLFPASAAAKRPSCLRCCRGQLGNGPMSIPSNMVR